MKRAIGVLHAELAPVQLESVSLKQSVSQPTGVFFNVSVSTMCMRVVSAVYALSVLRRQL